MTNETKAPEQSNLTERQTVLLDVFRIFQNTGLNYHPVSDATRMIAMDKIVDYVMEKTRAPLVSAPDKVPDDWRC